MQHHQAQNKHNIFLALSNTLEENFYRLAENIADEIFIYEMTTQKLLENKHNNNFNHNHLLEIFESLALEIDSILSECRRELIKKVIFCSSKAHKKLALGHLLPKH